MYYVLCTMYYMYYVLVLYVPCTICTMYYMYYVLCTMYYMYHGREEGEGSSLISVEGFQGVWFGHCTDKLNPIFEFQILKKFKISITVIKFCFCFYLILTKNSHN